MTKTLSISLDGLLDSYEEENRNDADIALRMIMWLMIYDVRSASWAREFLRKHGVFPDPEEPDDTDRAEKMNKAQLRRIDREREKLEKSVGLPPRGRRGGTTEYNRAFSEWKRLNTRPTRDEMIAGWVPQPLPASFDHPPQPKPCEGLPHQDASCEAEGDSPEKHKKGEILQRMRKNLIPK